VVDQLGLANEWFAHLAEPVRVRPRRAHFDPALTRSTFTNFAIL